MTASRRGSALWATLLVVIIATGIAAAMMSAADVSNADTARQADRARLRALAWSGIQSAMSQLAAQREAILGGADPNLTPDLAGSDTLDATVTLIPIVDADAAPPDPSSAVPTPTPSVNPSLPSDTALVQSESARLDLAVATPDMLHALAGASADALLAARPSSIEEALGLPRAAPKPEALSAAAAPRNVPGPISPALTAEPTTTAALVLTTFSLDPNLTVGASPLGPAQRRISIAKEPTNESLAIIDKAFADAVREAAKAIATAKERPKTRADLLAALLAKGLAPEVVAQIDDTLTTSDDDFVPGLVDLNRASPQVLATLPGLDDASAQHLAERRAGLPADQRRRVTWPLELGLVTPDQFRALAPCVTTRSAQWRLRVEAKLGRPSKDSATSKASPASGETPRPRASKHLMYEAVIDIATLRPRVAYLREVTFDAATVLAASAAKPRAAPEPAEPEPSAPAEAPAPAELPPPPALDPAPPPSDDSPAARVRRNGRWTAR